MDKIYDQLATKYHQFHDDTDRSCLAAAANGRLDILKQLKESGTSPREEAIYLAALHGHLPILEWHAEVNSNGRQPYCKYAYAILLAVAQSGNTEILKWVLRDVNEAHTIYDYTFRCRFWGWCRDVIDIACKYNKIEVLQHLHKCYFSMFNVSRTAVSNAATEGHIEVLQWLYDIGTLKKPGNRRKSKVIYSNTAIDRAAYNGHLNVLKWFAASGLEFKYVHAINYAIVQGHLDILKWFKASGYKFRYVCSRIRWDQVAPEIKNWMTENNIAINTSDHD